MSMELVLSGIMVLLVNPTYVKLLHWMVVLGYGHPILMSAWRSGTFSWAMVKRPVSSTLETDDMTFLILCDCEDWAVVEGYQDVF